jgi:hypothetical protein
MATATTAAQDTGLVTGLFADRDGAERAYRSIVSRGYGKDEISVMMTDETRKRLFPEDGLVTELGTKAAEEGVDLGNPAGGTLATLSTRSAPSAQPARCCFCRDSASSRPGPLPPRSRRSGRRHRGRSHRRAASLGHPRSTPRRIRARHQAGRHPAGREAALRRRRPVFRRAVESGSSESCSRVVLHPAGDGGRSSRHRVARVVARMLLCPEDLEPCSRPGCRASGCERTGEAALSVCWQCGVVISPRSTLYVCVECAREDAPAIAKGT